MILLPFLFSVCVAFAGDVIVIVLGDLLVGAIRAVGGEDEFEPQRELVICLVAGALVGALSIVAFPERIVRPPRYPGVSLVFAPLLVGGAMHIYGFFREAHGHGPSFLATFLGGGAFAFALALVRYLSFATGS